MTCERATALLLEVDLTELKGVGETELVEHLAACAECRARAQRIVAAERALGAALDGVRPRVHAPIAPRAAAPRQRRIRRRVWIPLALAVGIGALMLLGPGDDPLPPLRTTSAFSAAHRLRVEPPAGRSTVLYETENPNVIVVWFY